MDTFVTPGFLYKRVVAMIYMFTRKNIVFPENGNIAIIAVILLFNGVLSLIVSESTVYILHYILRTATLPYQSSSFFYEIPFTLHLFNMSLGIIIKAPEGLVLAAESRVTLGVEMKTPAGKQNLHVNFDNANKLLPFNKPYDKFGVVTYGLAVLGGVRTAQSLIPEFETSLQDEKEPLTVLKFAEKLSDFFKSQFENLMPKGTTIPPGGGMIFNVAGFDDNEPYGKVYQFEIPGRVTPVEQNPNIGDRYNFGIIAGGQNEIMARILLGYDPKLPHFLLQSGLVTADQINKVLKPALEPLRLQVPVQLMPLQDCVNIAVLLIKTTIEAQSLSIGIRGCGGAIDVAIITKNNPLKFIQQKNITVN